MTIQKLHNLISTGEGYYLEFKQSLTKDIADEMVAFANASGGKILLGVDDKRSIVGVAQSNTLRSQIQDIARNCDPSLQVTIQETESVIIVDIEEGETKPYRSKSGFFIRVGANSQKMNTQQIKAFIQAEELFQFDEMIRTDVEFNGALSDELVNRFIQKAGINNNFQSTAHILQNLRIIRTKNHRTYLTNAGILFFTQSPSYFFPQAQITCVAYGSAEKIDIIDRKDFGDDVLTNIEHVFSFLRRHLSEASIIEGVNRKNQLEIPEVALREAIVNAIAHRDYTEKGARILIELFPDRLQITSPGGMPKGLKKADLGKYSLSRNPLIAELLFRVGLVEKLGTGINRIQAALSEAKLQPASFKIDTFFSVKMERALVQQSKSETGGPIGSPIGSPIGGPIPSLSPRQKEVLALIRENNQLTKRALAEKLAINVSAAQAHIDALKDKGIITREGGTRGFWRINET